MAIHDVNSIVNELTVEAPALDIAEPPCKFCTHWNPQVIFRDSPRGQVRDGIRLCHSESQHLDFSCFLEKVFNDAEDDIPF